MARIIFALILAGLAPIGVSASKPDATPRSANPVLHAAELSGTWIPLQTCCPNPLLIFHRDGRYSSFCMDGTPIDGEWHLNGRLITLLDYIADEKGPTKRKQNVMVLSVDRHSSNLMITVRYPNRSVQTWRKEA